MQYEGDPEDFSRPDAGDDRLFVVFYMGVLKNEPRSIEEARPIFDDVEHVRIIIPGDKNNMVDRPVRDSDRRRFAKQYAAFKQGRSEEEQISGTRLSEWPFLSRAQCEELSYLKIRTVEQVANLRDDILAKVPGLVSLQHQARAWLAKAQDAAATAKMTQALDERDERINNLEQVVRDQADRLERVLAKVGANA